MTNPTWKELLEADGVDMSQPLYILTLGEYVDHLSSMDQILTDSELSDLIDNVKYNDELERLVGEHVVEVFAKYFETVAFVDKLRADQVHEKREEFIEEIKSDVALDEYKQLVNSDLNQNIPHSKYDGIETWVLRAIIQDMIQTGELKNGVFLDDQSALLIGKRIEALHQNLDKSVRENLEKSLKAWGHENPDSQSEIPKHYQYSRAIKRKPSDSKSTPPPAILYSGHHDVDLSTERNVEHLDNKDESEEAYVESFKHAADEFEVKSEGYSSQTATNENDSFREESNPFERLEDGLQDIQDHGVPSIEETEEAYKESIERQRNDGDTE